MGTSHLKNNLDGVQSVAPSSAKIQQSSEPPNKKLEIITYRFKNIENYAKTISSSGSVVYFLIIRGGTLLSWNLPYTPV